ncbi:MAG: hypothetical protein ACRDTA_26370 [Pseudonocardiaceae bacterium]
MNDDAGRAAYATLAGATVHAARERIVRLLRNSGNLEAAGHISHIEVVTTRDGELFAEVSL